MKLQTKLLHIAAVCLALVSASMLSYADSNPKYVPFQGRIHDDTGALNGIYTLKLSMYNTETGGNAIWTEEHKDVSVTYGYVNLLLGATTPFKITKDTVTTDIDFSKANFIGIQISKVSESGTASQFSNELLPRHRMVPSFHAIGADHAKIADVAKNAEKLNGEDSSYYASSLDLNNTNKDLYLTNTDGTYLVLNPEWSEGDDISLKYSTETSPERTELVKDIYSRAEVDALLKRNQGGNVPEVIYVGYKNKVDLSDIRTYTTDNTYIIKPGRYFINGSSPAFLQTTLSPRNEINIFSLPSTVKSDVYTYNTLYSPYCGISTDGPSNSGCAQAKYMRVVNYSVAYNGSFIGSGNLNQWGRDSSLEVSFGNVARDYIITKITYVPF